MNQLGVAVPWGDTFEIAFNDSQTRALYGPVMRLVTITNWAYGATVLLTLTSGVTMLLASNAQRGERAAVQQRYTLDQATSKVEEEVYRMTAQARQYVVSGDPSHLVLYRREAAALGLVEERIDHLGDAGAHPDELNALSEGLRWADTLHDEQLAAIAAYRRGDDTTARQIMFGPEYERELDRVASMIERFQYRLDQRTEMEIAAATRVARLWRLASEIMLGTTGFLFFCVLYFVLKRRVLRPVVRLSDVVTRLAAQDYDVEPLDYDQVDEIGDMAQAVRIFRENGLERDRLERERSADTALRDLLSRMTQRMQGCETTRCLTEVIQRFVPEIAPELAGRLYLLDEKRNAMVEACNWLSPIHSGAEFSPNGCWALRRGVPHRPSAGNIDMPCDHLTGDADEALASLCLPLTAQRDTIGLLYFEPVEDEASGRRETPLVYLKMLAENVGLALANLRLRDALRDMAMADALTGLANRRQLDKTLNAYLADAERDNAPVSCLMLDVDHFKRFNDQFGHEAGDAVLREVGAVLANATREDGAAFRYGGEEFLLLMPGVDTERAQERAEQIRRAIASLRIKHGGQELGSITASFGVASAPEHGPGTKLVQTADAALFRAKEAGRDRVVVANVRNGDVQVAA